MTMLEPRGGQSKVARLAAAAEMLLLVAGLAAAQSAPAGGVLAFDKSEYAARRAKLMDKIAGGAAVFLGAQPPTGFVPFVQSNDFLYLTGVEAPDAALIVDGRSRTSTIFLTLSERSARNDGVPLEIARDPAGAAGIERARPAAELGAALDELAAAGATLYAPFQPEELARECSIEKMMLLKREQLQNPWDGRPSREEQFVRKLRERYPSAKVQDASGLVWALRTFKSPAEVQMMRTAGRIGVEAYKAVLKAVRPGMPEYELAALFEYECKKRGAQDLAFYAIVCSGPNHPYVHYYKHDRILQDGDFVVMDCGPDLRNYDVDITVSFPVNGRFTPRQKEIYEAALAVHEASLALYKPGLTMKEIREQVPAALTKQGFDISKDVFKSLRGDFGHYVGMAVHDVAFGPMELQPGMVFANEPMAIFAAENLGVRVEDTILVTAAGCENLTAGIPRTVKDVERFMAEGKK